VLENVLRGRDAFDAEIDFLLSAVMGHVDVESQ
jgi:hypothetical protein